ncbi:hypothetical protein B0H11DRAFT_2241119 [Mycena galericulata]|nr:hypothetical protein B0H11DRAFT_2241119 [Mycena galericulata]
MAFRPSQSQNITTLKGCTFGWDDKTQVLHDVTLELAPRELHMVVGSVASGKSSLLMSILEETRLVEGVLSVRAHKIALASQTPFIYPGTLRTNILLDSPFDESFYDQVIHACGLRQDIEALPHRDLVKLGDKGAFSLIYSGTRKAADNVEYRCYSFWRAAPEIGYRSRRLRATAIPDMERSVAPTARGETEFGTVVDNVQEYVRVYEHGIGLENQLKVGTACTTFKFDNYRPGPFNAKDHIERIINQERQTMTVESVCRSIDWKHNNGVTRLHFVWQCLQSKMP